MNPMFVFAFLLLLFLSQNCEGDAIDWTDFGRNVTQRSMPKKIRRKPVKICDCKNARYKTCPLYDYIYTAKCFPSKWKVFFDKVEVKTAIGAISSKLEKISSNKEKFIEPPLNVIFKALQMVQPNQIKVIILGQDPTPQKGMATGLAFSVEDSRSVPAVLNVLLEVALEGWKVDLRDGDLTGWAKKGVLLLNTALTITQGEVGSHLPIWRPFTELLIKYISDNAKSSAWMLWGEKAKSFASSGDLIDTAKHKILTGQHPSPRSVTTTGFNEFFAGGFFKCANEFLQKELRGEINWDLTDKTFLEDCP